MKQKILIGGSILLATMIGAVPAGAQMTPDQTIITWSTSNFYPSYFAGKALPTYGSPVMVSVEAARNGVLLDLSQADITWELDGKFLAGGRNTKEALFVASKGKGDTHFVRVKISRVGELLETSIRIPIATPSVAIDAPYPGGEVSGNSMIFSAIPFFFNVASLSDLSFSWTVDGERLAAGSDRTLTVSSGEITALRPFTVTLEAANAKDFGESASRRGTFTFFP